MKIMEFLSRLLSKDVPPATGELKYQILKLKNYCFQIKKRAASSRFEIFKPSSHFQKTSAATKIPRQLLKITLSFPTISYIHSSFPKKSSLQNNLFTDSIIDNLSVSINQLKNPAYSAKPKLASSRVIITRKHNSKELWIN